MILGQVSNLDIFVFLLFLAPQLIIHVGLFGTVACALKALPFLTIKLPLGFIREHLFVRKANRTPFVRQASMFEDLVIRCVRYAFANIPANIGRVFFSKRVSLPFLRFRMLRHGYFRSPIFWKEVSMNNLEGLWIIADKSAAPDIVIYYAHGGGFSMGSSYFYLEFLLVWLSLLKSAGYRNPAIFALEYTLVPDACYPKQLQEVITGYNYILSIIDEPSKICVAGDSAGATIILSLLLHLARSGQTEKDNRSIVPGMAVLISPWVTLISSKDKNTPSDYLDSKSLHLYARQYSGNKISTGDSRVSPGNCKDIKLWAKASPTSGFFITYGAEEVFAPEIRDLIALLMEAGTDVDVEIANGGIHAWPVASLFLSSTKEKRQRGLKSIVEQIRERMN